MQNLPLFIKSQDIKRFNRESANFLWNNKRHMLSIAKLALRFEEGGLSFPDIKKYNIATLARSAFDWLTEANHLTHFYIEEQLTAPYTLKALLHCPISQLPKDIKKMIVISNIINAWQKLNKLLNLNFEVSPLLPICGNPKFIPGLSYEVYKDWSQKGLLYVYQCLNNRLQIRTFEDMAREFGLSNKNFFAYLQIRHFIAESKILNVESEGWGQIETYLKCYKTGKHSIALLYKIMLAKQGQLIMNSLLEKWNTQYENMTVDTLHASFKWVKSAIISTAWKESHIKIINKAYLTPMKMSK